MAIVDLHLKMADKRFLIALHHGDVTSGLMFPRSSKINMAAKKHKLVYQIENYFPNK